MADADVRPAQGTYHPKSSRVFAIDCEMGITYYSMPVLLHISMVDDRGEIIMDTHVKPDVPIVDYKTHIHGISARDLEHAPDHADVYSQVYKILQCSRPCVLVGHNVHKDLNALRISSLDHGVQVRDTANFPCYQKQGSRDMLFCQRKLSHLIAEVAGVCIQKHVHNPVEDAAAAIVLYLAVRELWESELEKRGSMDPTCSITGQVGGIWRCSLGVSFLHNPVVQFGRTPAHARRCAANTAWVELLQHYNSHVLPIAQCKSKQIIKDVFYKLLK